MIESELKLAQMTRNIENHNRTTAYERSEINGYLNGLKRVPQTLHSASELVHIHRQEHCKALSTIIYKSHNMENTNLSSIFLSTILLASLHIYYVGCGNTGMFCRSAPLFFYPTRKNLSYNLYYGMCIMSRLIWIYSVCLFSYCCVWRLHENVLTKWSMHTLYQLVLS